MGARNLEGEFFRQQYGLDPADENEILTCLVDAAGKPIYRKKIDFGLLPATSTKNVAHGITGLNVAEGAHFRIWGVTSDGTDVGPLAFATGVTDVKVDATNVKITTSSDQSSVYALVFLEYTKS